MSLTKSGLESGCGRDDMFAGCLINESEYVAFKLVSLYTCFHHPLVLCGIPANAFCFGALLCVSVAESVCKFSPIESGVSTWGRRMRGKRVLRVLTAYGGTSYCTPFAGYPFSIFLEVCRIEC